MDPNPWQVGAWVVAVVGGLIAAGLAIWQAVQNRQQREQELRWKQAEAGKKLNDEMLTDPEAWAALQMLDNDGYTTFELPSKKHTKITDDDLRFALDPSNSNKMVQEKHIYVRRCFDSLFYYMATLEHYTNSTLILSEDIAYPLDYYVPLLAEFREVAEAYLNEYKLTQAKSFLSRYPVWEEKGVRGRMK